MKILPEHSEIVLKQLFSNIEVSFNIEKRKNILNLNIDIETLSEIISSRATHLKEAFKIESLEEINVFFEDKIITLKEDTETRTVIESKGFKRLNNEK